MIVIVGAIVIACLIIIYGVFSNMTNFATHPGTIYLLIWFFSLLVINLLMATTVYGYYYYKQVWSPFGGVPGLAGYEGPAGDGGPSSVKYECKKPSM